jgi:hypothetical protein
VAKKLGVQQPTVSKIERQTDMYLSTLRGYIAALGGELQIVAQFPDRALVHITNFKPLRKRRTAGPTTADGGQAKSGISSLKRERTTGSTLGVGGKAKDGGQAKEGISPMKQGRTAGPTTAFVGKGKAKEVGK